MIAIQRFLLHFIFPISPSLFSSVKNSSIPQKKNQWIFIDKKNPIFFALYGKKKTIRNMRFSFIFFSPSRFVGVWMNCNRRKMINISNAMWYFLFQFYAQRWKEYWRCISFRNIVCNTTTEWMETTVYEWVEKHTKKQATRLKDTTEKISHISSSLIDFRS